MISIKCHGCGTNFISVSVVRKPESIIGVGQNVTLRGQASERGLSPSDQNASGNIADVGGTSFRLGSTNDHHLKA
jgi:hypothetical protein